MKKMLLVLSAALFVFTACGSEKCVCTQDGNPFSCVDSSNDNFDADNCGGEIGDLSCELKDGEC